MMPQNIYLYPLVVYGWRGKNLEISKGVSSYLAHNDLGALEGEKW